MQQLHCVPVRGDVQIKKLAALAAEIWREYFPPIIGSAQVEYMLDKFQSEPAMRAQMEHKGYEYFRLLAGGQPVGYTGVRVDADGSLFLSKLYVHKDHRGHGYASAAMRFLCALCADRGLGRIWLTVNRDNADTIAVYRHMGFEKVREQKADIGGGFYMDDFILQKRV